MKNLYNVDWNISIAAEFSHLGDEKLWILAERINDIIDSGLENIRLNVGTSLSELEIDGSIEIDTIEPTYDWG